MTRQIAKSLYAFVGVRIKELRRERGLTQSELAGHEFSKGYVSALERGAVRPSFRALDVFARRLGVPMAELISAESRATTLDSESARTHSQDKDAILEDAIFQANYAKMLIRSNKLDEAFDAIGDLSKYMQTHKAKIPAGIAYLAPFLRGRAYLQSLSPDLARPELEDALQVAGQDPEAAARVRNLLGVVHFELSQPHLALEQHLLCMGAIRDHTIGDPNFRLSVYGNTANDYWALRQQHLAIGIYKQMLPLLEDISDLRQQAKIYWGMAVAYNAEKEWPYARLYATKALDLFEACDDRAEAASACLSIAETLIDDGRFAEVQEKLEKADKFLSGAGSQAVSSFLHRAYADLERRQGRYENALKHAEQSVELAQTYYKSVRSGEGQPIDPFWQDPVRVCVQALQMKAYIEEDLGRREVADQVFEQALTLVEGPGFEETSHALNLSYAKVLQARGDFEHAVKFYQAATDVQSTIIRP